MKIGINILILHFQNYPRCKKKWFDIFFSAEPVANIINHIWQKLINNNTYIDFDSSIEFINKGYTNCSYAKIGETSLWGCETFFLKNKLLIYIR